MSNQSATDMIEASKPDVRATDRWARDLIVKINRERAEAGCEIYELNKKIATLTADRDDWRTLAKDRGALAGDVAKAHAAEIARLVSERDEARRQRDALVDGIREMLAPYEGLIGTHYTGCDEFHWTCKLRRLLREVG